MADPEFAEIVYEQGMSFVHCPCRVRENLFLFCQPDGTSDMRGHCLKCWACGRVMTADGAVIGAGEFYSASEVGLE